MCCSSLVSIAKVNIMTKNSLRKSYLPSMSPWQSITEGRNLSRKRGEKQFPDSHIGSRSTSLFIQLRLSCLGIVPPTVDWPFHLSPRSRQSLTHWTQASLIWRISIEVPSSKITLGFVKFTLKAHQDTQYIPSSSSHGTLGKWLRS